MKNKYNLIIKLLLLSIFLYSVYSIFIAVDTLFPSENSVSQSGVTSQITLDNGNKFEYYDI